MDVKCPWNVREAGRSRSSGDCFSMFVTDYSVGVLFFAYYIAGLGKIEERF